MILITTFARKTKAPEKGTKPETRLGKGQWGARSPWSRVALPSWGRGVIRVHRDDSSRDRRGGEGAAAAAFALRPQSHSRRGRERLCLRDMTSYTPDSSSGYRGSSSGTLTSESLSRSSSRASSASYGSRRDPLERRETAAAYRRDHSDRSGREWKSSRWMLDKVLAHRHNVCEIDPFCLAALCLLVGSSRRGSPRV